MRWAAILAWAARATCTLQGHDWLTIRVFVGFEFDAEGPIAVYRETTSCARCGECGCPEHAPELYEG